MRLKINFFQHALERMDEREISQAMVENALNFPDKVEKSLIQSSRILVKKLYFNQKVEKEHLLIVILEVKINSIDIITIIDTSKINKYY